jgi:S-adenosylmethionine hydrolase
MADSRSAPITLTTDFGAADPFVGIMKGVILGIHPGATIVDITHEIPPQDVTAGAYHLSNAWRHFPPATVHVAVVDPGVGSSRRAIAISAGGHMFVGPDNGVFTTVLPEAGWTAHEISSPRYLALAPCPTFHGRDIFAPAAAHLARGVEIGKLGRNVPDPVRLAMAPPRIEPGRIHASVIHVDRFGNVVLDVEGTHLAQALAGGRANTLRARIGAQEVALFVTHYAAAAGAPCLLINSDGRVEIAVAGGSAAARFDLSRGARILLEVG